MAQLSRDLQAGPDSSAAALGEADAAVLREHGVITSPMGDDAWVRRAMVRSSSSNLAGQAQTSGGAGREAATGWMVSRVRHRVGDGALFAFKIGGGLRLPVWQFRGHDSIPGLRAVLAALPDGLHPLEVLGPMTTPDTRLAVADVARHPECAGVRASG